MTECSTLSDPAVRGAIRRLARAIRGREARAGALSLGDLVRLARGVADEGDEAVEIHETRAFGPPMLVVRLGDPLGPGPALPGLTRRETEVASLVADGLSNKQIARRLSLAVSTVKDHVHRILTRTALPNRAAVAAAYRSDRCRESGGSPPDMSS